MDRCYNYGISELFLLLSLAAVRKYQIDLGYSHLDSTSFSVHGEYNKLLYNLTESSEKVTQKANLFKEIPIKITHGYSRDHRPDLKQFMLNMIISGDGDIPIFIETGSGNQSDKKVFGELAKKYKEQQAPERGFAFLKDPLFFADSVFLKNPQRVETMAMLMGLCLLVYSLGQRQIRTSLQIAKTGIKNQLGKLTEKPTLRWIFQCFQGIHLVEIQGNQQIANLTSERYLTLSFFSKSIQNYYILSG